MTAFVTYDSSTGRILSSGDVPESALSRQEGNLIVGEGRAETHYVIPSLKRIVEKPPAPSPFHEWDYFSRRWEYLADEAWGVVRQERNELLSRTDFIMLPDSPFSPEEQTAWSAYRQALRDITDQPDPLNITWPTPPSEGVV